MSLLKSWTRMNVADRINTLPFNPPGSVGFLAGASATGLARALASEIPALEQIGWGRVDSVQPSLQRAVDTVKAVGASTIDNRTLALLAADVYRASANPPGDFRVAEPSDLTALGLRPQDLTSTQSAFSARVYVQGAGADAEFVVAFRGSSSDKTDWISNLRQGVGLNSDHYARALQIGERLARNEDANVTLVGHSLGGGLASAAAVASGRDAATFNAAGLSNATIRSAEQARTSAGVAGAGNVTAFYISGEILSAIQDGGDRIVGALFGGLPGAVFADAPEAYGTRVVLDPVRPEGTRWYQDTPVARHGMDWVLASFGGR
jgi:Protein of unknown function (DUF2974)